MTTDTDTAQAPKAQFLPGPAPRTTTVQLKWPVEIDGTTYREVVVRRLNGREARSYHDAMMASLGKGLPEVVYPGLSVGQEVWEELDDDDVVAIAVVVINFLPERFQPLLALIWKMAGAANDAEGEAGQEQAPATIGGSSSEPGGS